MVDKISDQWSTPQDLFNVLDKGGKYQGIEFKGFNFDIDLCATGENSKCEDWFSDYLTDVQEYKRFPNSPRTATLKDLVNIGGNPLVCFMNPPYSNPCPFIEKAWEDSRYCKTVCLVKCDPSITWWATFWDYGVKCRYCDGEGDKAVMNAFSTIRFKCPFCTNGVYSGPKPGCEVMFFPKRINFEPPQVLTDSGIGLSGPTFPSALIIMDRRTV